MLRIFRKSAKDVALRSLMIDFSYAPNQFQILLQICQAMPICAQVWEEAKQLSRNPEVKQENLRDLDRTMTSVRLATKCLEGKNKSCLFPR